MYNYFSVLLSPYCIEEAWPPDPVAACRNFRLWPTAIRQYDVPGDRNRCISDLQWRCLKDRFGPVFTCGVFSDDPPKRASAWPQNVLAIITICLKF